MINDYNFVSVIFSQEIPAKIEKSFRYKRNAIEVQNKGKIEGIILTKEEAELQIETWNKKYFDKT